MEGSDWHHCTHEEDRRIAKGRINNGFVVSDDVENDEDSQMDSKNECCDEESSNTLKIDTTTTNNDSKDAWMFDSFEVLGESVNKIYKAPDSSSLKVPWIIEAFSINQNYGLTVAEPIEIEL